MWATHGRNLFVLTSAGKPVWSLWGTETEQSGITSVLQAIISNSTDQGDTIWCVRIVFCFPRSPEFGAHGLSHLLTAAPAPLEMY